MSIPRISDLTFISNFEKFSRIVSAVRSNLPKFTYSFMEEESYRLLATRSICDGNRVYIQEILFRAHWAALTSIVRNFRWMAGMDAALKFPNYFSFCANLRGMLEAAADSHDALELTIRGLTNNFHDIRVAMLNRFDMSVIDFKVLEDALIHYCYGRRLSKSETAPKSHRAKEMRDYLARLDDPGSSIMLKVYAELCEITHPAAATVHFFGKVSEGDPNALEFHDPEDMGFIVGLMARHNHVFDPLFQKSFNVALLALYTLNCLNDARFYTPGIENVDLSKVPAFSEIVKKINGPKA